MRTTATTPEPPPRPTRRSGRQGSTNRQASRRADELGHVYRGDRQGLEPVPEVIDLRVVDLDRLDVSSLTVDRRDHLVLNGEHAVSARDTDALASGLFALVRHDCHADRLLVWQELANTLNDELDDDGRLALSAARLCCADIALGDPGRDFSTTPLAEREYKSWWKADEQRRTSWPSVSSVRRRLGGSWLRVVEHLGQSPTPSSLGRRLAAQLGAFTPEELKAQLALCRSELSTDPEQPLDYVTLREHREWALKRIANDDLPLPRLCLQPHPFRKAFGSWPAAVLASGGCRTTAGRRAANTVAASHDLYTGDACVQATRFVGRRAGGPRMRWQTYNREARALKSDPEPPADIPAVLPSAQTIVQRLGSWPHALFLAGFIDAAERDRRLARVTVTLSDKQLLKVIAGALRAIGGDAPTHRYRRYREAMRAQHGPHIGLPSLATVYQRLGHWPDAKTRVIAAFPDISDCIPTWTEEDE